MEQVVAKTTRRRRKNRNVVQTQVQTQEVVQVQDTPDLFNASMIKFSTFVSGMFLPVYLSSLIIAFFYANDSVDIDNSELVHHVFDISNRICIYYMLVVVAIGILRFIVNFPFLVIFGYSILVNLFLTSFAHLFTYLMEQNGVNENNQTDLRMLFDMRMSRRDPTESIFGTIFGNVITKSFNATTLNIFSTLWETLYSGITGYGCQNTWGGYSNSLLWKPADVDFSENVMGKLCWYLEEAVIQNLNNTANCPLLYILRFVNTFLTGFHASDYFFKMTMEVSVPKITTETDFRLQNASTELKSLGIACNPNDFRAFVSGLAGKSEPYEDLIGRTLYLNSFNDVPGLPKKVARLDLSLENIVESLDKDDREAFVTAFKKRTDKYIAYRERTSANVASYLDNSKIWDRLGFNLDYLFLAEQNGSIKKDDVITEEHQRVLVGLDADLEGIGKIEANKDVQDKIERTARGFGDYSCSLGGTRNSCCDVETRPFQANIGYVLKDGKIKIGR